MTSQPGNKCLGAALLQLVINEVSQTSSQSLQAVKLLAQHLGHKRDKVTPCATTWPA